MGLAYSLDPDGEVVTREVSEQELINARTEAGKHNRGFRSCWNCNPSHRRFLEDTTDNHFFTCFSCGHHYFNGIDITEE